MVAVLVLEASWLAYLAKLQVNERLLSQIKQNYPRTNIQGCPLTSLCMSTHAQEYAHTCTHTCSHPNVHMHTVYAHACMHICKCAQLLLTIPAATQTCTHPHIHTDEQTLCVEGPLSAVRNPHRGRRSDIWQTRYLCRDS